MQTSPAASIDEIRGEHREHVLGLEGIRRRVVDLRRTLTYNPPLTMAKHSSYILDLARSAATVRWNELQSERSDLLKAFPDLRNVRARTSATVSKERRQATLTSSDGVTRTTRTRKMSPAARRAVSLRMKKYWAARRKEKSS